MNRKLPIDPDFWRGLPGHLRITAPVVFLILITSLVFAGFATWSGFYRLAGVSVIIAVAAGGITWWLIGDRFRAWWRDEGWRCKDCGERVGYGSAVEAFRLKGVLGDLTHDRAAHILCSENHYTPIIWDAAWNTMRAELAAYAASASGKAEANRHRDDPASQALSRGEKMFADKANALVKRGDPGDYLYLSLDDIRAQLENFSYRRWAGLNREQLYRMLSLLEAYKQVVGHRSSLGAIDDEDKEALLSGGLPERIHIEEIDNFSEVRDVSPAAVAHIHDRGYINCEEEYIKVSLEEILHEPLHKKDWAGELNDLYTSNVSIKGRRYSAAFMLKGPGIKTKLLTIKDCGLKGTQLVKLFDSPAEIHIVQFVGNVDEYVIKDVAHKVVAKRSRGGIASYCIINGQDTARLLHAYGKL